MVGTVSNQPKVVYGACPHDCPDTCSMLVTVQDDRAIKVEGNPDHPFTRGTLCGKVSDYLDRVYSEKRVLYCTPCAESEQKAVVSLNALVGMKL